MLAELVTDFFHLVIQDSGRYFELGGRASPSDPFVALTYGYGGDNEPAIRDWGYPQDRNFLVKIGDVFFDCFPYLVSSSPTNITIRGGQIGNDYLGNTDPALPAPTEEHPYPWDWEPDNVPLGFTGGYTAIGTSSTLFIPLGITRLTDVTGVNVEISFDIVGETLNVTFNTGAAADIRAVLVPYFGPSATHTQIQQYLVIDTIGEPNRAYPGIQKNVSGSFTQLTQTLGETDFPLLATNEVKDASTLGMIVDTKGGFTRAGYTTEPGFCRAIVDYGRAPFVSVVIDWPMDDYSIPSGFGNTGPSGGSVPPGLYGFNVQADPFASDGNIFYNRRNGQPNGTDEINHVPYFAPNIFMNWGTSGSGYSITIPGVSSGWTVGSVVS